MKRLLAICFALFSVVSFAQDPNDTERCEGSEPTYITRMPGFYISDCRNSDYNDVEFIYFNGQTKKINKGGKYYRVFYFKNEDETRKFSSAQIRQNYYNAILKVKGQALDDYKTTFFASINGKEVYIQVNTAENSTDAKNYNIEVVEVESMQQDVLVNLEEAIDKDGKVALYGILFDIAKSDIKPESKEILAQISDYLNANPAVKIFIVGHTDNTGTFSGNMSLSKARAESIKNYLVTNGKIAADRLQADGVGQLCPVSSNKTEEGKKLNRRVEIVLQ